MASMRPMRKSSRMSSPLDVSTKEVIPAPIEQAKIDRKTWLDTWIEPPLRTPAPSFEDHKGLERHGVLEHMAPLGSFPTQKVKLRVKPEPPKRVLQVKNGHSTAAKERARTPDSIPIATTQLPQSRKVEEKPPKPLPSRETEVDDDYTPKGSTKIPTTRSVTPKDTQAQNSLHGTPNSRTPGGRARLETVVNSAVARSYELGNPVLGLAVKKLFDESLGNRTLADLLDAVLSQKPTPRQATDFQAYIKVARKQIKAQKVSGHSTATGPPSGVDTNMSSKSTSKSPSKSVRLGAAGENRISKEATPSHPQKPNPNPDSVSRNKTPNGKFPKVNGMETRAAKRSRSSSDTSSLSSLSSIDQTFAPSMETDHANTAETHATPQPMTASKVQPSLGPKLHTFSTTTVTNTNTSLKRTSAAAGLGDKESEESLATKKAKLSQKTFEDYTVQESSIRVGPAVREPDTALAASKPSPSSSAHTHQTRLRNGAGKRPRDDNDDFDSLSSSAHGDLLVPPPPGAQLRSRSGTPRDLGRPSKIRKTARVKMS